MATTNINYLLPKGDLLKARRMELGLTQDDLVEKSNVSKNTISAYERNASRATPSSAKSLAKALNMELVDLFEYPAVVEEVIEVAVEEVTPRATDPALKITSQADDVLRMAAAGLEKNEGSPERVSFAIANITGYLRSIVCRAPELKENSQGLVDAFTVALSTAVLDPDRTSMEDMWSVMKNGIAELKMLDRIPSQARIEAETVIAALQKSRMDNDDTQRLQAVKAVLYWLHAYWTSVCKELSAYNTLSGASCAMASAPTDYSTRARLVAHINTFFPMLLCMILSIERPIKEKEMDNEKITTFLTCPVCQKAKILSYGASGKISSHCPICRRTIMWDFDSHKAYPISNYPSNNLKRAN